VSTRSKVATAVLCFVLGVAFVLLAVDVQRWQSRLRADDASFASTPPRSNQWAPSQVLPLGTAKALLALADDVSYRQAVREFLRGQPRSDPFSDTDVIARRGHAEELLAGIVEGDQDPGRRSAAANLIGVLGFANAVLDASAAQTYLSSAADSFRTAISIDPENADAKYNLELALARLEAAERSGGSPPPPDTASGSGAGAGTGRPGSGY
jgi:hypothetical protein